VAGEGGLVHWDDVEPQRAERGHLAGSWRELGREAGSVRVTVNRIEIDPGRWSTPAHVEGEEIFYVLGGTGLSWQDGEVFELRAGDCIVHRAGQETHTLRAGDDGLDVLAYGPRSEALTVQGHLPRARVSWLLPSWVETGAGARPWEREAAAGEPEVVEVKERPPNIVNVDSLAQERWIDLADAAGSVESGLNLVTIAPGKIAAPAHCHSAEEEIFVVLEGAGTLELVPSPRARDRGHEDQHHAVRAGHVVARPAGTQIAHAFRGGAEGMKVLMYGWRDTNDITYYPRSNKIAFRGVGLIARLEPLGYWDGEEAPG
jgi:uncharacterized cupin superfamily protein